MEVLAFEMDANIVSLEDQLATAHEEKDVITSRSESLALELQELSDELDLTRSELCLLKEEISILVNFSVSLNSTVSRNALSLLF